MSDLDQSLTGIGIDNLDLTSLTTQSLNNIPASTLSYLDATSSIQTQLNNMQTLQNAGGSGGYFCIYGEIADLKTNINTGYFQFGGSLASPAFRLGIFTPACSLIGICLNTTTSPATTAPIISVIKLFGGTNPGTGGTNFNTTITMPIGSTLNKITTNVF